MVYIQNSIFVRKRYKNFQHPPITDNRGMVEAWGGHRGMYALPDFGRIEDALLLAHSDSQTLCHTRDIFHIPLYSFKIQHNSVLLPSMNSALTNI